MDYQEMHQLSQYPDRVRSTALRIMKLISPELTENAQDFLHKLSKFDGKKPMSTREKEFLFSLREKSTRTDKAGGFSAAHLIQCVYEARYDLQHYEDEEWIEEMFENGFYQLSRSEWRRLLALCRELNLIERNTYVEI